MANVGQAALVVVGTVVGAYFGNPQLGLVLGSLTGSLLFPTQLPAGPRITDNRTTTATIGEPVPILFGTADLAGTVIWVAPVVETASEQGGKGGPEQKIFNYNQSIGIGLCERVDDTAAADEGAIGGVTRIWENGTIVYDIRAQQEANTALGFVAETDQQYADRLAVSAAYATTFTLYLGDELQDPDPTIEAIEGMGNVPGFRGLAYIVYPNRALQVAQGLRHPNFTFECFKYGAGDCTSNTVTSNEQLFPWIGNDNPENPRNINQWVIDGFDPRLLDPTGHGALADHYLSWNTQVFSSGSECEAFLALIYGVPMTIMGYRAGSGIPATSHTGAPQVSGMQSVSPDPNLIEAQVWFNLPSRPTDFVSDTYTGPFELDHIYFKDGAGAVVASYMGGPSRSSGDPACPTQSLPFTAVAELSAHFPPDGTDMCGQESIVAKVTCTRFPNAPPDPCLDLLPSLTLPGFAVQLDGTLVKCGAWTRLASPFGSTTFKALQKYIAPGGFADTTHYPLNPCIPAGGENDTEAMWTAAYDDAVSNGWMAAGLTYKATELGGGDYPVWQNFMYTNDLVVCQASGTEISIAEIIAAVCKRAGLAADQIDVSDLGSIKVGGYSISGICDAADIISPLRSIGFFDCVESGKQLRFPTRGKEVVATLSEDQFGCFDGGSTGADGSSSTNIPPSVAVVRQDETTLPRSIRFHYKAVSRDYQDAEQDSPFRLTTKAIDDQDISIPVCLDDDLAIKSAEIIWSDAWAGQNSYTLSVDQSLAALEVADCIGVPVDGVIQRMRIVSDSNAAFVLRKLQCVADDQGSYISFAVATPPAKKPSTLTFLSPSLAVFLNIPSLMDADNNAGFYVVAYPDPASGNKWNGAVFYQSVDGTNFSQSVTSTQAGTVGTMDTAVPPSESFTWDSVTVLTVNVPASESFESRTDDAVLAGANAAAMGADGRWEIIQFATATQISPTQWQLSRLLRGRRGTEYVMGSSEAGDQFVMVSTGDLVRIPLSVSQIGAAYVYKVVSVGAAFSTGNTYDFTSRGTALVPFSPVDAAAAFISGGDIEISWTRRDRLGETLMSGMDVPLSDFPESFQVDIVEAPHSPSSPAVVFRTLATGTTSVIYAAADFATDYGGPHSPPTVYVRIYQMSLTMGRGTPEVAALVIA
jgi:hypothetical protein